LLDFTDRSARVLYTSPWQLQGPAVDPSGRRVAVLEGWASDRGLVAGTIRLIDIESGDSRELAADRLSDLASVRWRDADSLWCAGWSAMGSLHGIVRLDGSASIERDEAVLGPSSFLAQVLPSPDQAALAAIRETVGEPPEVVLRGVANPAWQPLTSFNAGHAAAFPDYPEVRQVAWRGADDLPLEGLLLLPPRRREPSAMIVCVHGGPTWSVKHAYDPGHALPLAAAGYPVFLPNYRGSVGWGQDFTRKNLADPGGAEFDDILRGIDWCIAAGIADPARIGITGVSYGGYMTAWAVATSDRFAAAVMISGISDLLSCHYACNHDFCAIMLGGALTDDAVRRLYIERSPLVHVAHAVTPTMILHGRDDLCTPLSQAEEFHRALADHGVATELVAYPREGHGFQERGHHHDAWQRAIAWFDRHLQENR
ncbi:MAG: alpha/beta hydrolase family protein, partial [Geminicoccaceae bacterium]